MTIGILIIGYGTRNGNLEQILQTQVRRLRCRGWEHVAEAYFRVSEPSIPEALGRLVNEGADEIIAIPYYIAEGKLTKDLIPEKLGMSALDCCEVESGGKKVTVRLAPAFCHDRRLTSIVLDRVADAGGDLDSGILIIGHGTRHDSLSNMRIVRLNAERLKRIGYRNVEYSFNEFCDPPIKECLDRLEKSGVKKIIAVPLFIAMGLHLGTEITEQLGIPDYSSGGDITVNGRPITIAYTRPVEDDPRITDLLEETVRESF